MIALALALALAGADVCAGLVGVVVAVYDPYDAMELTPGASASIAVTYPGDLADQDPDPVIGSYACEAPPGMLAAIVGPYAFASDVEFSALVRNDDPLEGDLATMSSSWATTTAPGFVSQYGLRLVDPAGLAVDSDALPTPLAPWATRWIIIRGCLSALTCQAPEWEIVAELTETWPCRGQSLFSGERRRRAGKERAR